MPFLLGLDKLTKAAFDRMFVDTKLNYAGLTEWEDKVTVQTFVEKHYGFSSNHNASKAYFTRQVKCHKLTKAMEDLGLALPWVRCSKLKSWDYNDSKCVPILDLPRIVKDHAGDILINEKIFEETKKLKEYKLKLPEVNEDFNLSVLIHAKTLNWIRHDTEAAEILSRVFSLVCADPEKLATSCLLKSAYVENNIDLNKYRTLIHRLSNIEITKWIVGKLKFNFGSISALSCGTSYGVSFGKDCEMRLPVDILKIIAVIDGPVAPSIKETSVVKKTHPGLLQRDGLYVLKQCHRCAIKSCEYSEEGEYHLDLSFCKRCVNTNKNFRTSDE